MVNEIPPARHLLATQLANDPRVAEAKKLLHLAIEDCQKHITGICPPLLDLKQSYQDTLDLFAHHRGAKLWYPYLGSGFGNGVFVELADGSIKYDMICGIGSHYCGHQSPLLIDAAIDAALSNTVMQGNLQQNIDSCALTSLLIEESGLPHCFLTTSGAMANENALKIAFQKHAPASRLIAFEHCFAGRTLVLSQVTDKPAFREGLPLNVFVDYIPFFNEQDPDRSIERSVNALKQHIARYPKQHAAMVLEFIQGEAGFYPGSKAFFHAIIKILKDHNIAVIADEVQTFARTPYLFAYQYFELTDLIDIATIGKVSQTCATLFTDEYQPRPGLLSQTFTSSTAAIKASYAIISHLLHNNFFGSHGKIAKLHEHFAEKLTSLAYKYPQLIQGPFGIGTMIAFTPYQGNIHRVTNFAHRLFDAGVISFVAGGREGRPMRIRFLLPVLAMTTYDIDQVVHIVERTLLEDPEHLGQ